jgi:hypothetical protein
MKAELTLKFRTTPAVILAMAILKSGEIPEIIPTVSNSEVAGQGFLSDLLRSSFHLLEQKLYVGYIHALECSTKQFCIQWNSGAC